MELLGVKFAPLAVPFKRRLETAAAVVWFTSHVFGNLFGWVTIFYMVFCTQYMRYLAILYLLWMYYDWDTCARGGRRFNSLWVTWFRNMSWLRYFCDYFPAKLVKTTDLDPSRNYLFGIFPHGVLAAGPFLAFGTDVLGCKEMFPGLEMRLITLSQHFKTPFFREYAYGLGACDASVDSLNYLLSTKPEGPYTGRVAGLIVGGAAESLECRPRTYRILLKKRKGFINVALRNGSPLVPVCAFGETDLYDQVHRPLGTRFRAVQDAIRKKVGLAPVLLLGRGMFQYSFGLLPYRKPMTIVVGSPLEVPKISEPTAEQVDEYHEKFIKAFVELFETHKHKYVEDADSISLELVV